MRHLVLRSLLLLTIGLSCLSFSEPGIRQSKRSPVSTTGAVQIEISNRELTLTIPLSRLEKKTHAHVQMQLLNPDGLIRAQLSENLELTPRQKQLIVKLAQPLAKVPASEMETLHWMRLRYELRTDTGDILSAGIEPLQAPQTDPFVMTAAASRVAPEGLPYRVQVHLKENGGNPIARAEVHAELTWDDTDGEEKKLNAKAISDVAGNATVEFSIPLGIEAERGELTVAVKSGLVTRSVERGVYFSTSSYLLLDTDKDIYQPGQSLHARILRFDSKRKAVDKETLDFRIDDEEQTLVFKQTATTDAFGIAHVDWQIPDTMLQGNYQVRVKVSGQDDDWRRIQAAKSVHIYRYDLPNFRVIAKPDKSYYLAGQDADVTVSAEYLFGKPVVRGKVRIVEESNREWNFRKQQWEAEEGQVETGELDRDGKFTARFDLSEQHDEISDSDDPQFRDLNLAAYVTDLTTGRTEQRRFAVRVTRNPIHVYVSDIPYRNGKFPATFYVSTFYADGTPARCKVQLSLSDHEDKQGRILLRTVETNKYGLARVSEQRIPSDDALDSLLVEARDGKGLTGRYLERIYGDDEDLGIVQVTTSRAIHKAGDPIEVTLRSTRPNLRLLVQAVREGVVLASRQAKLRNGHAYLTFPYDPRFTDEVAIFAFSLEEEWSPTVLLEGIRTVLYPKNRKLDLSVQLDKSEHRPGEGAVARFAVRSADKTATESALGVKIVDQAVEERARTDSDFGHRTGGNWWRWSLWSSYDESGFSGVSRDDLDQVDLAEPVPADLDLVAEFILRSGSQNLLDLLNDRSYVTADQAFSKIIEKQFEPLEAGLRRWNEQGKQPRNLAELETLGKECDVDVQSLLDPWDVPYRYQLTYQGTDHDLVVTSAGPDKHFGTKDDFTAHGSQRNYFQYYGKLIDAAMQDIAQKEGRFVRDRDAFQSEMLKRGVDFNALHDPWGTPYEMRFSVSGSYFVIQVVSHGQDAPLHRENPGMIVWDNRVDYFARSREYINKVLTAHLNAGGVYPSNEAELQGILRKSGVDLNELRDPWAHAYFTSFQKVAQYGDRIKILRRVASGERAGEPVTLVRQDVRVLSSGPDGKPGTADDFQVGSYSMLVSEQSAKDVTPVPAPGPLSLTTNTGAITGTVIDPSGAVVGNANVEAAREDTAEKYTAKTDAVGRFELKDLPPGVYDIKASAQGFRGLEVKAVLVQATNVTEISFELSLGASTESVEVSAAPALLETTMSSAITARSVSDLVKLAPGAEYGATKSGAMSTPRLRQDFPETMLWEPALVTDRHGHAKLNFKLADNITTWRLTAIASTKNGELGKAEKDLRAFQPFFVEHDPPRILTQGDEIAYPVVLRNYLDRPQTLKTWIKPESWFTLLGPAEVPVKVDAGDATRAVFRYRTVASVSDGKQQVSAANAETSDAAQKTVDVHPFGRPVSTTASALLDQNGALEIRVPENAIAGSVRARVKIYPNLLAHLTENLEAGLEKPHGCGEQTISSTYPSLLVAEIYAKNGQNAPIALKAQRYLAAGYERLLHYQGEDGGFSYWGHGAQSDLALTAYALEFLHHASALTAVDDGSPQRAEKWLLGGQLPDGSWRHGSENDKDALFLTAYIAQTLALLNGEQDPKSIRHASLERALVFLSSHRDMLEEPYAVASYALAAQVNGDEKTADALITQLRRDVHHEQAGSYWALERNSPFYAWGRTGRLEATALALRALATSHQNGDEEMIRQGILFLLRNEDKDGMWYSGQTTVHVLKALLTLVAQRDREPGAKLAIRVNGQELKVVELPASNAVVAPIELDASNLIRNGNNKLELETSGQGMMSAQFVAESYVPWGDDVSVTSNPDRAANSTLRFVVEYSKTKASTDDKIECRVRAERLGYRGYGMMLGEVGLPPGADVDRESLEQALQGNYAVYRYDVLPDRVVLYMWPEAGGSAFSFQFRPRFAMEAETAPSLLYDYYNPESSVTVKPQHFSIVPGKDQ